MELGNATGAQLLGFLLRFYPDDRERAERLAQDYPTKTLSPAQIQQILIAADSIDDAERALRAAWKTQVPAT